MAPAAPTAKTTIIGVHAPQPPRVAPAPPAAEDAWGVEPESAATKTAPLPAVQPEAAATKTAPLPVVAAAAAQHIVSPPAPPVGSPAAPPVVPQHVAPIPALAHAVAAPAQPATFAAQPAAPGLSPAAAQAVVSATDLRLIMREMIDQAVAPLLQRVVELERRPRAPSSPAFTASGSTIQTAAPLPAAVQAAVAHAAPAAPYASAMVAPSGAAAPAAPPPAPAPRSLIVAQPPLLDVAAIERDVPLDMDIRGFDGGRRKRRMVILFVLGVLVLFGGLFAMLAESYSHTHN